MNTTNTTTEAAAAGSTIELKKWETGNGLGPRMAGAFNKAMQDLSWASKGVQEMTGIIEKPETHERGMVFVTMFGGAQHPEYSAKVAAIQAKHGHVVTAANYKALVADIEGLTRWFNANPMIKDLRVSQAEHDEKEAKYAQAMAENKRRDDEHAAAKAKIVADLRAKYPWAVGRRASENLKTLLMQTFPGIVFSVRSDSNSLNVSWENGPSDEEVRKLGDEFRSGSFNGMTDSFDFDNSAAGRAWSEVMGSVRYVGYSRKVEMLPILEALKADRQDWDEYGHHSLQSVAYRLVSKSGFLAGAVPNGVARVPGVTAGQLEDFYTITYTTPEPVQGAGQAAPITSGVTVSRNVEKGGVEIRFPAKPDEATINRVKAHGFRWSRFSGCWWAKATADKLAFAYGLAGQEVPQDAQGAAPAGQSETVRDPGEDAADRWAELQHGLACNA